ncbi:MAG: ATP-dependent helicase [Lachnospiraceae bacterium]|nr:ATP-dependent helicase [Lachnospiraceae bacterium]
MKVYETYDSILTKEHLIDFDDMIIRCRDIFYRHEGFLRKWQRRFRYYLVDEFQDINRPQYDVLRLLAGDEMNVFAVGGE